MTYDLSVRLTNSLSNSRIACPSAIWWPRDPTHPHRVRRAVLQVNDKVCTRWHVGLWWVSHIEADLLDTYHPPPNPALYIVRVR